MIYGGSDGHTPLLQDISTIDVSKQGGRPHTVESASSPVTRPDAPPSRGRAAWTLQGRRPDSKYAASPYGLHTGFPAGHATLGLNEPGLDFTRAKAGMCKDGQLLTRDAESMAYRLMHWHLQGLTIQH
jgi:hypothetical protein